MKERFRDFFNSHDEDNVRVGRDWMRYREFMNLGKIDPSSAMPCVNGKTCPHRGDKYPCRDCERDVFKAIEGGNHG